MKILSMFPDLDPAVLRTIAIETVSNLPYMSEGRRQRLIKRITEGRKLPPILICSKCGDWVDKTHTPEDCVINMVLNC